MLIRLLRNSLFRSERPVIGGAYDERDMFVGKHCGDNLLPSVVALL